MALSVLIVDDSAVMRGIVLKTLRLTGLPLGEVQQAKDGQEALELCRANWFDLALVDINMPRMNGEEFIHAVRAEPATGGLKIVVVSTESSETRIAQLRGLGAEFVHKPFTPPTLRSVILTVLGHDPHATVAFDSAPAGGDLDF